MSKESGGIADKLGNRYEDRYVLQQMVAVIMGRAKSIELEPRQEESGVDLIVTQQDGSREFHQCKMGAGNAEHWTLSLLASYRIFEHVKEHASAGVYVLVSPLSYTQFQDLCDKARLWATAQAFLSQATKKDISLFKEILKKFDLPDSEKNREYAFSLLKRIRIFVYLDNDLVEQQLRLILQTQFSGDPEDVYNDLITFPKNKAAWATPITASMLVSYLQQHGHLYRRDLSDSQCAPCILELNQYFMDFNNATVGHRIERPEVSQIEDCLRAGKSAIILGKAGCGKSQAIACLTEKLHASSTTYLAVDLKRYPPEGNTCQWGISLGLTESPVLCLESLVGKHQIGVLILDQLDTLRWTTTHLSSSISVCKRLLEEATSINRGGDKKILVVLISRTFDYENDPSLNRLVTGEDWQKIELQPWGADTVSAVIGEAAYRAIPASTQSLLSLPCNIFIWFQLDLERRNSSLCSSYDLMRLWLNQLFTHAEERGLAKASIRELLDKLLCYIMRTPSVPRSLLGEFSNEIDFCISENFLLDSQGKVTFAHQSISDYLSVNHYLEAVLQGKRLESVLPDSDHQTPAHRIVLQTFWQTLMDTDPDYFGTIGETFLRTANIRFYYKCTFWEAMGQCKYPTPKMVDLLKSYWNSAEWKAQLFHSVFYGHASFVQIAVAHNFFADWMDAQALSLLHSINEQAPDFVADVLCPYAFESVQTDHAIINALCFSPEMDSDKMFALRMQILEQRPDFQIHYFGFAALAKKSSNRAISYIALLLSTQASRSVGSCFDEAKTDEAFKALESNSKEVIAGILPIINANAQETSHLKVCISPWSGWQKTEPCLGRFSVQIVQRALIHLLQENPAYIRSFVLEHMHPATFIEQELILKLLLQFSAADASLVYAWMAADFPNHLFDYSSEEKYSTSLAYKIIQKFSPFWENKKFHSFEAALFCFHDKKELEHAKIRFEQNKEEYFLPSEGPKSPMRFLPYWGSLQEALLPALDQNRTLPKTKRLIAVLQHRAGNDQKHGDRWSAMYLLHRPFESSEAVWVGSSLSKSCERISNAAWVAILMERSNAPFQRNNRWNDLSFESSPEQFAHTFELAAKKDPLRFLQVIEKLPAQIRPCYISAILSFLKEKTVFVQLPFDKIVSAVKKYTAQISSDSEYNVCASFCWLVQEHSDAEWPRDIYNLVVFLALKHVNPKPGQYNVTSNDDPNHVSTDSISSNALNCIRGTACYALASVLRSHPECAKLADHVIQALVFDGNDAVRFAAVELIAQYSKENSAQAYRYYREILMRDVRILAATNSGFLFLKSYEENAKKYLSLLTTAFHSKDHSLMRIAAQLAFEVYYRYKDCSELVLTSNYTDAQVEGLTREALANYNSLQNNELLTTYMKHLIRSSPKAVDLITRNLCQSGSNAGQDITLLLECADRMTDEFDIYDLVEYLLKYDCDAAAFFAFARRLCRSVLSADKNNMCMHFYAGESLSKLLLRIEDQISSESKEHRGCLDLWDELFQSDLLTAQDLLKQLNQ